MVIHEFPIAKIVRIKCAHIIGLDTSMNEIELIRILNDKKFILEGSYDVGFLDTYSNKEYTDSNKNTVIQLSAQGMITAIVHSVVNSMLFGRG
jgi:hypothetical protein